ncbi:MAG: phosphoribosylaminoimidazolesuccinocarboxamide synthase [Patescibacteria group bacterium]
MKRKILVIVESRSDLPAIRDGLNVLRLAVKKGLIDWQSIEICSSHHNLRELNAILFDTREVDAIIAIAGKSTSLFSNIDSYLRHVLHNYKTRVIPVPLKSQSEQESVAALYSVLEAPDNQFLFCEKFFHNPASAFQFAVDGELEESFPGSSQKAETLRPSEAYELARIKYPAAASYDDTIIFLEGHGLYHEHTGKNREIFSNPKFPGLLYVLATDRIAVQGTILNASVYRKGAASTAQTIYWLKYVFNDIPNHLVAYGDGLRPYLPDSLLEQAPLEVLSRLLINMIVVKKAEVLKVKATVKGYLTGSDLEDYQMNDSIYGYELPPGLIAGDKLPEMIFFPVAQADYSLRDENIDFEKMSEIIGAGNARAIREKSLYLYSTAHDLAEKSGLIIAETTFEFGVDPEGRIILIGEVLTPDSSLFWLEQERLEARAKGLIPPSLDKQLIINSLALTWLKITLAKEEISNWKPPKILLKEISKNYQQIFQLIAGKSLTDFWTENMDIKY